MSNCQPITGPQATPLAQTVFRPKPPNQAMTAMQQFQESSHNSAKKSHQVINGLRFWKSLQWGT